MSTETYTGTDQPYMPVIITAEAAVTSPSSGVIASTATTGSKATDTSKATSTSTAGGPTMTGNSFWGLGVAAVAFAMMG